MKKSILLVVFALFMGVMILSCKDKASKNKNETEMHSEHNSESPKMVMQAKYQCPMDCEDGKTYDEPGNCPVCKMDLKKLEGDTNHENHDQ